MMPHIKESVAIALVVPLGSRLRFCLFFITTSTFIFSVFNVMHCNYTKNNDNFQIKTQQKWEIV